MSKFYKGMLIGIGLMSCVNSLIQDFIGKEKWLHWAEKNWISGWITIPIAIITIIIIISEIMKEFKNDL